MTIAYIISAYRLPQQLLRLVERLQQPGCRFYVHVDLHARPEVWTPVAAGLARHGNVELLPRVACPWGGFGHVRATLSGLERIASTAAAADYVVLLTGQDYPIKTSQAIREYFTEHEGRSFINHRALPVPAFADGGYGRLERWHTVVGGRVRALPAFPLRRRVPYGLHPYFGSGYWCLHRSAVTYIMQFLAQHPQYVRFFEHVGVPDEMFFQTILLNSPLRERVTDDDLRCIKWPGPAVLTTDDLPALRESGDLFARKFDVEVDEAVLGRIDRELLGLR